MEVNSILSSDFLDIIFDGRNKDYGAYELRKTYNKRMTIAFIGTSIILLLLISCYMFANKFSRNLHPKMDNDSVTLVDVFPDDPLIKLPPPPKPKPEPVKMEIKKFTPPLIVNDEVKEADKPPLVETLADTRIGAINQSGVKGDDIVDPPFVDGNKGIINLPKKDLTVYDGIFGTVEIESAYPGGVSAWMRYLNKTFRYPSEAQETGMQGTVMVQFIVDKEGNVSDVEAMSGPATGGLREEAVRVIRKSGRWEPAIQNGRQVKSYKRQPITFKLAEE